MMNPTTNNMPANASNESTSTPMTANRSKTRELHRIAAVRRAMVIGDAGLRAIRNSALTASRAIGGGRTTGSDSRTHQREPAAPAGGPQYASQLGEDPENDEPHEHELNHIAQTPAVIGPGGDTKGHAAEREQTEPEEKERQRSFPLRNAGAPDCLIRRGHLRRASTRSSQPRKRLAADLIERRNLHRGD